MNAVETMAKAHWNASADEYNQWNTLDQTEIDREINAMRAALLTLSEVYLPDTALAAAFDAGERKCFAIRQEFSAIVSKLAEEF